MDLDDLIHSIDIVEYISQFVDLEEKNGEFWGLSPFTNEKTPSFSVRKETQNFYCFSSGIGGNVFTFVKFYNKCSSSEAINILKEYVGCSNASVQPRKKLATTAICKKYMHKQEERKSTGKCLPESCMERYEVRSDKLAVWEKEGISAETLKEFQVCYDSFSDRLVYPIRNLVGEIINVGGRSLDPQWKEKKLRKYTYFYGWPGGEMNVVYGLFENMAAITKQREVILFEGCKSVLLAHTWGIYNTGALLTSHLSKAQMLILAKLGVRVVFALDKGVQITHDHNIQRLKQFVNVEYIVDNRNLINEKDAPVDHGIDVYQILYAQRVRLR